MSPAPIDFHRNLNTIKPKTKLQKVVDKSGLLPILSFLDKWSDPYGGWAPHHIFYTSPLVIISYTVSRSHMQHNAFLGIGSSEIYRAGDRKYYSHHIKHFTPLGQWFEEAPGIVSIVKLPYYIVMWPITFILSVARMLVEGLFLSRKKKDTWDW